MLHGCNNFRPADKVIVVCLLKKQDKESIYCTEGNFGGGEIWRIKQNITVGEIKFGELLAKRTPY